MHAFLIFFIWSKTESRHMQLKEQTMKISMQSTGKPKIIQTPDIILYIFLLLGAGH